MQETEYDCVVVFGAAVWPGYFGPVASHALRDRTLSAVDLYNNKLTQCIILSGGESIYGAHEVDVMTDILLENNVPESVIELDREGVNTIATINNLNKSRSYILVSNDFHLARIGLLAQRAGLGDAGFALHAAEYRVGGRYRREYYFTAREAVALWYYFFVTLI
jgi:vancomycin permeability regulator SanA